MKKVKPTPFKKLGPVEQLLHHLRHKLAREERERDCWQAEIDRAEKRCQGVRAQIASVSDSLAGR